MKSPSRAARVYSRPSATTAGSELALLLPPLASRARAQVTQVKRESLTSLYLRLFHSRVRLVISCGGGDARMHQGSYKDPLMWERQRKREAVRGAVPERGSRGCNAARGGGVNQPIRRGPVLWRSPQHDGSSLPACASEFYIFLFPFIWLAAVDTYPGVYTDMYIYI